MKAGEVNKTHILIGEAHIPLPSQQLSIALGSRLRSCGQHPCWAGSQVGCVQAEGANQDERREKAAKMNDAAAPGYKDRFGCQVQAKARQFFFPQAVSWPCASSHKNPLQGQLEWL